MYGKVSQKRKNVRGIFMPQLQSYSVIKQIQGNKENISTNEREVQIMAMHDWNGGSDYE